MKTSSRLARRTLCVWEAQCAAVFLALGAMCVGAGLLLPRSSHADERGVEPLVLEMKIDGEVEPILATYIDEGLADAAHRDVAPGLDEVGG